MNRINTLVLICLLAAPTTATEPLVYNGLAGPGAGMHIVFLAGEVAYRSEESLPALARIMAKHHGFKCTVLFNVDESSGEIVPGNSNMPGIEALVSADLAVVFLRFQNLPPEQMQHFDAYLRRGGPVVGLRTATYAFKGSVSGPYEKYSFDCKLPDYKGGFGHQVLGQTWVGHYGKNHSQSTRIRAVDSQTDHCIMRGVQDIWVQSGAYVGTPTDCEILTTAQPLRGMSPDDDADATKSPQASEWTRTYKSPSGKRARVFTSLSGAPEDLLNDGYRRMLVNGMFWAVGLEDSIDPKMQVNTVGPFKPNTFLNGGHAAGIKPSAYVGFGSPIPAHNNTKTAKRDPVEANAASTKKANLKGKEN